MGISPQGSQALEAHLAQYKNADSFQTEYSSASVVPPEVREHIPSGSSIIEEDAVMEEFGRTYRGYEAGKYFLPIDPVMSLLPATFPHLLVNVRKPEQDRLDFQHALLLKLFGKLACAPMAKQPHYVLDVATGTGYRLWTLVSS
jgi:hypothetical protein